MTFLEFKEFGLSGHSVGLGNGLTFPDWKCLILVCMGNQGIFEKNMSGNFTNGPQHPGIPDSLVLKVLNQVSPQSLMPK
jgi:hypothetical protein